MSEQYTPVVSQQQAKTCNTLLPIDPNLLRNISGGLTNAGGAETWAVARSPIVAPPGGEIW